MGAEEHIPIILVESLGIKRTNEPVKGGIPLERGFLFDKDRICLSNKNKTIPLQTEILSKWPDESIKWLLLDFKANVNPNSKMTLFLKKRKSKKEKTKFYTKEDFLKNVSLSAIDHEGIGYNAKFNEGAIETEGYIRKTIKYAGKLKNKKNSIIDCVLRASFYSDSKLVRLDLTVRNPRAAEHEGGLWDLGDKGSIFIKDLSIKLKTDEECDIFYKEDINKKLKKAENIALYQDSSGNKNWNSKNHVDRNNKITCSFKGYKIFSNNREISYGDQAQPIFLLKGKNFSLSTSLKDFWQNFPKATEANKKEIIIRLFPMQSDYLHELQGGEQKTHTLYLDFEGNDLDWIQSPLRILSTPEYYAKTKVFPYLTTESDKRYQQLIDSAIIGKTSFDKKNEVIDEYGWRNFGDIYADHEALHKHGLISHYNNQYDIINGALLQFFRSGNDKWWTIADNLAKHVRDIDMYHTKKDKSVYNGGMFWHTFHYTDAFTSTHRSYSRLAAKTMGKYGYGIGGGPSNEHNYATGLMNHYFLTGDELSKEAAIILAEWVINMDDGSKSILGFFSKKPTGKASQSHSIFYHGPGRGSGNSVNVLLDGFEISKDDRYLLKAEELIRRCIHPKGNIAKNNLGDVEHRWFYLVFLQALGRYLDTKLILNQTDYNFYYAKESLLHYARWIVRNEVPYKEVLHKVEVPSETWPAQDIRKTVVLDYAYRYSGEKIFKDKSQFFYNRCIEDLKTFKTKSFTRPLAILMHYSALHGYFEANDAVASFDDKKFDFGKPKKFRPQGYTILKLRELLKR